LSAAEPAAEQPVHPYPGLRPFEFGEDYLFFGREGQSDEILRRLRRHRFVAVIGTSGSGKSSLIRAGLLPALYGGQMAFAGSRWRHAIFRPGNAPIGNLARALCAREVLGGDSEEEGSSLDALFMESTLRRTALGLVDAVRQAHLGPDERLLIVVDQMEELFRFRQRADEAGRHEMLLGDESAAFVKLLLGATRQTELPIYVVISMRSDFIGECARYRDLPEAVNEGLYLIPRMTRDQRKEAIAGPAAVAGAQIAPRLMSRLLNDVGDDPGQLPILQHALMRTWDLWAARGGAGRPLDLLDYEAIGGMDEALSRHADEAYRDLPDDRHRGIAKRLFQSLTEKGPDNRGVRRPTQIGEVMAVAEAGLAEVVAVIEAFGRPGRSFLTSPCAGPLAADCDVDISHESLIGGWKQLAGWVEEEADSAREYRRLADTAARHAEGKADLLHEPELSVALKWRDERLPSAAWARRYHAGFAPAMAFLDASEAARNADLAEEERQHEQELQRTRRQLLVTTLLGLAALLLACFAGYSAYEYRVKARESRAQAQIARTHENMALRYTRVSVESLETFTSSTQQQSDVQALQERLVTGAMQVQDKILEYDPENHEALLSKIGNLAALPELHVQQGDTAGAEHDCQSNQQKGEELARDAGYFKRTLGALLYAYCASTYGSLDKKEQALRSATRAAAIADTVWSPADPRDDASWWALGAAYRTAAKVHRKFEQPKVALHELERAVAAREKGLTGTESINERQTLLLWLNDLAEMQAAGDHETARRTYLDAIRLAESWASAADAEPDLINVVVAQYVDVGDALMGWQEYLQAEQEFAAAGPWVERLKADTRLGDRDRLVLDERLGSVSRERGLAEKDPDKARAALRRAVELHMKALARNHSWEKAHSSAASKHSLAISEYQVGQDLLELKEYGEARQHLRARLASLKEAMDLEPGDSASHSYANGFRDLAECEEKAGDPGAARAATDRRIKVLRTMVERPKPAPEARQWLATAYGSRSWYDLMVGDFAAAVRDSSTCLEYDGKAKWCVVNQAHGYLLGGQVEQARKIYLEKADQVIDGKRFEQYVLKDFKDLRAQPPPNADLSLLAKVEEELAARRHAGAAGPTPDRQR
jgi:energy-coupling factor transporter ATP-binding protein EcfA2